MIPLLHVKIRLCPAFFGSAYLDKIDLFKPGAAINLKYPLVPVYALHFFISYLPFIGQDLAYYNANLLYHSDL